MTTGLQAGWLGMPILALLMVIAGLSAALQKQWLADYRWRGELQQQAKVDSVWQGFMQIKVNQPQFHLASLSSCVGFCALNDEQNTTHQYQQDDKTLSYQWQHYKSGDEKRYYRLCATRNHQQYHCWWWQEERLHSQAWVSLPD